MTANRFFAAPDTQDQATIANLVSVGDQYGTTCRDVAAAPLDH